MKMLVVDDMEVNRMILQHYLEPVADIDFAVNGIQAVQKFNRSLEQSAFYDAIFLDLMMPEMDGTRTVMAMRQIEENKKIPQDKRAKILIVTSNPSRENVMKTYKFCQGYLIKPVTAPKLYQKLEEININCGVDHTQIEDFLQKYIRKRKRSSSGENAELEAKKAPQAEEKKVEPLAVSDSEIPPSLPVLTVKDGHILAIVEKTLKAEDAAEPEKEYVDAATFDGFQSVQPGKIFARLESSSTGIAAGEGVMLLAGKLALKASAGGKIVFDGTNVCLSELLEVKGPVSGNLDFEGRIKINGDIRSGARIRARGSIEVSGKGESCSLESSEGPISIQRLDGKGNAFVKCAGDFNASFLYESSVESGGSIVIEKESVSSVLKARRKIKAGNVVGGECRATDLIEIRRAGSPKDVNTLLSAGYDFTQLDAIEKTRAHLRHIEKEIDRLDGVLGPYAKNPLSALSLPENKMEKVFVIAGTRCFKKYSAFPECVEHLAEQEKALTVADDTSIVIDECINNGVTLMIGEKKILVEENLKGSFKIVSGANPDIPEIIKQEK